MTTSVRAAPRPHARAAALGPPALVALVALAVAVVRTPSPVRHRLWAEDGRVFLGGALAGDGPLTPYDGYLHLVPRLLAELVVALVEPGSYDVAVKVLALGLTALVCAATWSLTADLLTRWWTRALVALTPVLLPAVAVETLGNAANLHTFGLWLVPWLLLHRPSSRAASAGWAVVAVLVGLSEILAGLFVPLLLVGRRDALQWPPRVALLGALAAQVATTLTHPRPESARAPWDAADLAVGYLGQVGGALWSGSGAPAALLVGAAGTLGLLVLLVPPVAALVATLALGSSTHRILAVTLAAASVLLWTASATVNFQPWMDFASWQPERWRSGLLRYAASAGMFLLALVWVAVDAALDGVAPAARAAEARARLRPAVVRAAAVAVAVAVLALCVVQRDASPRTLNGPRWPTQEQLLARCAAPGDGGAGDAAGPVELVVPTPPRTPPGRWAATLPCDAVRADRLLGYPESSDGPGVAPLPATSP